MLKKRNRLSRREFDALLKRGRRLHSDHVTVVYASAPPQPVPCSLFPAPCFRAGAVVSKKVARKAVERNRLRRLVYHELGEHCEALHGKHVAVLLKKGAATVEAQELRVEARSLVLRLIA